MLSPAVHLHLQKSSKCSRPRTSILVWALRVWVEGGEQMGQRDIRIRACWGHTGLRVRSQPTGLRGSKEGVWAVRLLTPSGQAGRCCGAPGRAPGLRSCPGVQGAGVASRPAGTGPQQAQHFSCCSAGITVSTAGGSPFVSHRCILVKNKGGEFARCTGGCPRPHASAYVCTHEHTHT